MKVRSLALSVASPAGLLLIVGIALGACLASCKIEDHATPAERVELEEAAGDVDAADELSAEAFRRAEAALRALPEALASEDPTVQAAALSELQAALAEVQAAEGTLAEAIAAYEEVHGPIAERIAGAAGQILLPWLPAPFNGPLGALILASGSTLLFDRSRKHVKIAVESAIKGKLVDAINALMKAMGYKHSTPTTERIAKQEGL